MATRNQVDLHEAQRAKVAALITAKKPNQGAVNQGIWQWVSSTLHGLGHDIGQALGDFAHAYINWIKIATSYQRLILSTFDRLVIWFLNTWIKPMLQRIDARFKLVQAEIKLQFVQLRAMIMQVKRDAYQYARELVRLESTLRYQADQRLDSEIKTRIKWLHQAIEREAVSGYKQGYDARLSVIQKVADQIANQNPLTRALVKRLVAGVLDLVAVDDPLARLVLSFLVRHVIDRLGLDRVIGNLLQRLLEPLLGAPRPRSLSDVIVDLSARLLALEQQWAEFMANGGAEVEQAGTEWQLLTSLIGDAALLLFLGDMCYRPDQFAREVSGTAGRLINDTIIGATQMLRKV